MGVYFSAYQTSVDRLTVLKTTYPEELYITSQQPPDKPKVISVVAFRGSVRSDARYIASFEPTVTSGQGFVSSLSLMAKFQGGVLQLLQWYNLTCNDCGGRTSARCINATSCALPDGNCTCASNTTTAADTSTAARRLTSGGSPSEQLPLAAGPLPGAAGRQLLQDGATTDTTTETCTYANMTYCATSINLAFEGLDAASAAFNSAPMIRKLNSYSLVSLFYKGKAVFNNIQDYYTGKATNTWGSFTDLQQGLVDAYSGNAQAGRTTGTASSVVTGNSVATNASDMVVDSPSPSPAADATATPAASPAATPADPAATPAAP